MPLSDQKRVKEQRLQPRIVTLWRKLSALKSVAKFMNSGAHPDDETSAMLAAMTWRDGIDISYVCSTRGEGGQNDIGVETGAALGALRTAEMERACDVLGLRMYWLGYTPDDPLTDFGFSKSGVETLSKWGRDHTLHRLVTAIRMECPDILCPTFLDIPGQHGHHRAMTEAALEAFDLAADPNYVTDNLPLWKISKLYLPAWSGAGDAYDDDLPPPPATLTFDASGQDPVTGWSFEQIGQHSRVCHATQGMGRWVPAGSERNWPLHLAKTRVGGPDDTLLSGIPQTLADLADGSDAPLLAQAQAAVEMATKAFPDMGKITEHALDAFAALSEVQKSGSNPHIQRIERKIEQLSEVVMIAAGAEVIPRVDQDELHPGDQTILSVEIRKGTADSITTTAVLPEGWDIDGDTATISDTAALSDPYPSVYLPGAPIAPYVNTYISLKGQTITVPIRLEQTPLVLPTYSASITPDVSVLNTRTQRRTVNVTLQDITPEDAEPSFDLPKGWQAQRTQTGFALTAPADQHADTVDHLQLRLNGKIAHTITRLTHNHTARRALITPTILKILSVKCELPNSRIGYIGAQRDTADHWLNAIGCDITAVPDDDLLSDAALAQFDTLLIGIFAMRFRQKLSAQMPRIHKWVEAGGTLVTLYHRPWDNWDPATTPPRHLEIGKPSLRWRVTDETAEVTVTHPHAILTTPNKIGAQDWDGWHKERGLYFAKDWADDYIAPLSMHDPDEASLNGALLVADIGAGRHVHTSLILHHQMASLTPGAFRLMANLLNKRE